MFSTDALTWPLAFCHHLRLESCKSETGFSHVAWVKVGFNITGGQRRSCKKDLHLLENRSQGFCGLQCKSKSSFGYDSAAGYIDAPNAPKLVRINFAMWNFAEKTLPGHFWDIFLAFYVHMLCWVLGKKRLLSSRF